VAYRVYPDGREELVRNGELSGMTVGAFKDILAVSKEKTVFTYPFAASTAGISAMARNFNVMDPSQMMVSYVTPSMLFEDISIQPPQGEIEKAAGHWPSVLYEVMRIAD